MKWLNENINFILTPGVSTQPKEELSYLAGQPIVHKYWFVNLKSSMKTDRNNLLAAFPFEGCVKHGQLRPYCIAYD